MKPIQEETQECSHIEKKPHEDTSRRQPTCEPEKEAPEESKPAATLLLDFWPPELWGNKIPFFKTSRSVVFFHCSPGKFIDPLHAYYAARRPAGLQAVEEAISDTQVPVSRLGKARTGPHPGAFNRQIKCRLRDSTQTARLPQATARSPFCQSAALHSTSAARY